MVLKNFVKFLSISAAHLLLNRIRLRKGKVGFVHYLDGFMYWYFYAAML